MCASKNIYGEEEFESNGRQLIRAGTHTVQLHALYGIGHRMTPYSGFFLDLPEQD